jgi:ketol-acid reductoisomerase
VLYCNFSSSERHKRPSLAHNQWRYWPPASVIGQKGCSRLMINNYSNTAQLKDLMTAPPMTAAQHAEIMRKRNEQRRKIEDAREARKEEQERYGERR